MYKQSAPQARPRGSLQRGRYPGWRSQRSVSTNTVTGYTPMPLPLAGIRVVDFGRFIAAPYCGMLLADMGADCVRVERREGGEDRRVGPVTDSGAGGLFLNLNRNKRGMTLDLGHARGREILEPLVRWADIVIVNLPLATMKSLGLDYASLCRLKPDIILVMASAFGPDGPYADRVGFDSVAQAASGAMSLTGFPGAPVRSIVPFADYGTALHAAFGAMVALYQRQQTGTGQLIDVSLLATSVAFMQPYLAERAATADSPRATGQHRLLDRAQRRLPHARRLDHGAHDRRLDVRPLGQADGPRRFSYRPPICRRLAPSGPLRGDQ